MNSDLVKESNPKDAIGIKKVPFSTIPSRPITEVGLAMLEGALKYGRHNYRAIGVRSSVYYDACLRHLTAYWEGQDIDPDSGLPHIIKAIACLVVLRDSQLMENCVDDRPPSYKDNWQQGLNKSAGDLIDKYPSPKKLMSDKIDVLDHGFVRLIDSMGSDLSVVRAARVSYDAAWRAGEDGAGDEKLINYLWRNKHTSPFESVTFTFEVKAPIFVFRQWHRHRTWSFNELSARYKELPEEFYIPDIMKIGVQSNNNKQGRSLDHSTVDYDYRFNNLDQLIKHCKFAFDLYHQMLEEDWPRELARIVLPLNTYSHMFCTVNLLNLLKFCTLRSHEHAQYEIRVYSDAMLKLIESIVPVTMKAYNNNKNA